MQSAMNALNPVLTIDAQMRDACKAHSTMSASGDRRALEARCCGSSAIDPIHLHSYPHQLSGGMRQRAMIAMALLFTPDLVIMDEPTSALDVVAQRSLMVQIKELQEQLGFAVIFVTHDMSLVSHFSDRLLVMYAGQVAEFGATRARLRPAAAPVHAGPARRVPVDPRAEGARCSGSRAPARSRRTRRPAAGSRRAARSAMTRCIAASRTAAARRGRAARPLHPLRERRSRGASRLRSSPRGEPAERATAEPSRCCGSKG